MANRDIAFQELRHALALAEYSRQFFDFLLDTSSITILPAQLNLFIDQKRITCRIFEEMLDDQ